MAGFASSRPGWGDARPGYAWFFGRDACWCGDALLAAGLFTEARLTLEFLAHTADVTGKVAHEVTASGVAHYDAADATPLFLRYACAYAEWTGDVHTIRSLWPQIRAAVAFVRANGADRNGLPDNRGVGHGWIESGPLGGGSITSYTASIWIDALRRLQPLAARMGDEPLRRQLARLEGRARRAFEGSLRDPITGLLYLQLGTDGTPVRELTALAAVPIALGVDGHVSAQHILARLGSDEFSTPWGVRLISRQDARYRPRGYHFGAVWPLFTGWTALAAYARRDGALGWRLLLANARCAQLRSRGAFDEVLDGDTGAAAGVCADQAWSAAMLISPFIQGVVGMQPSALAATCTIDPQWPAHWAGASLHGLRVGKSRFSLAMESHRGRSAGGGMHRYAVRLDDGPPLSLRFGRGRAARTVTLEPGREVTVEQRASRQPAAAGRGDDGTR
ncbi:MAG: amylo-alpha-1,6-glucosidase [Gemmatimonadaceae bacterium]